MTETAAQPRAGPVREGARDDVEASRGVRLTIASYNIHRCYGRDGRHDPARIAAVIEELGADVIALQEVESMPREEAGDDQEGLDQFEYLAAATGFGVVAAPTLLRHRAQYGNVLLTRHPVLDVRRIDLSVPGREPRSAIDADLDVGGRVVRVIATHFGLRAAERRQQVARLLEALARDRDRVLILLGDFNEWLPFGPVLRAIEAHLGAGSAVRTFPARRPLFALDRIWVQPRAALATVRVHLSPRSRMASDHLPICAAVTL